MKKTYLLSSIFILTILLSSVAYAEVTSTTTTLSDLRQKILDAKQRVAEEKDSIIAKISSSTEGVRIIRQEIKDAVEARIGKRLAGQKMKVAEVFEKAIQNLKDLILRIESRMTKMESGGIDISASKVLLETAKAKLALSETELANLENMLTNEIPTATSTKNIERKDKLAKIKAQSEKTKISIKVTHKSIVDVIESLKAGFLKEKKATSTSNL